MLFFPGIGTDGLVIPNETIRFAFLVMPDDITFVIAVVSGPNATEVMIRDMERVNFR
jgi:hypothetical protein